MFRKILMVEDVDEVNTGLVQALQQRPVMKLHHVRCFETALAKMNQSIIENDPYDLIVSEIAFRESINTFRITICEELIGIVRTKYPQIKIIIYSSNESRPRIESLFKNLKIDAYVFRGRKVNSELKRAVITIYGTNNVYISKELLPEETT